MLEQVQTKDKKPIWKKLQYKGSLLVEYAIILGLAAIFLVFNGLFDPIGDKADKNAKAVNKDAYVYGGVPKGSVTPTPDDNKPPTHIRPVEQIIAGTPSLPDKPNVPVNPGDKIQTNIQFTYDSSGQIWSPDTSGGAIIKTDPDDKKGDIKYFSFNTLLSFGSEAKGKYKIFFNKSSTATTTNTNDNGNIYLPVGNGNKDFAQVEIEVIIYKYNEQNKLISEVLNGGFFSIQDIELTINKPCYVAFNFRGDQSEIGGINDSRKSEFIKEYMKIVKL